DEEDGDENGDDNLLDRLGDENIRVVDDCRIDARRKILFQLLDLRQNFMIDRERVGAGLGIDKERRRIAAVTVGCGAVIRGTDLDPTDVTDARYRPRLSDLTMMLPNCSGVDSRPSASTLI